MTLDLLINQVLEKDAACFLQCETQSIEARAAKTWGGWIPTSNCWQHRAPQSKHWITEAEQWPRGPTWRTLTQPNLLSVWSNFHKYWAKGIISLLANIWHQSLPHISQIPSSITECPPTGTEAFVTQAPPPSRPLPLHHFLKIFPPCLTSLVLGLPCLVSERWRVFGRLWVLTGCKGGLVHLCWSNSRFRATPTSPCLFPNCASLRVRIPSLAPITFLI